jgi:hypothetical protein
VAVEHIYDWLCKLNCLVQSRIGGGYNYGAPRHLKKQLHNRVQAVPEEKDMVTAEVFIFGELHTSMMEFKQGKYTLL